MESKVRVIRKIEFDAAHRLVGHESRCAFLHGHRYAVHVYAEPREGLDTLGRVVDFSVLKEQLGGWIDNNFDHQILLNAEDGELIDMVRPYCRNGGAYMLPFNPTAENIGRYLLDTICPKVFADYDIVIPMMVVDETPNCRAVVFR